jgi:small conductance mechanosensitive channel
MQIDEQTATDLGGWFQQLALTNGLDILMALIIVIVGRWVARILSRMLARVLSRANVDQTLVDFLSNVAYYLGLVIVIIAALSRLGFPTTTIVAVLGAGTLAVGLALQDTLSNFAAGWLIVLLKPYRLGDYVSVDNQAGFVQEIKIFHTMLIDRDNRVILIPNSDVLDSHIINHSHEDLIRLDLTFGIGYGDDLLKAKQILEQIMAADERIAADPAPSVAVRELGDNSVNLAVRPYVQLRDEVAVRFAITEQVKLRFDQAGVSIPFPQRDIHLYQTN